LVAASGVYGSGTVIIANDDGVIFGAVDFFSDFNNYSYYIGVSVSSIYTRKLYDGIKSWMAAGISWCLA